MSRPCNIHAPGAVAQDDGTSLYSIRSFFERYPNAWPSAGALRFLINTKRDELRRAGAVFSPPGVDKLLIDERRFLAWLRGDVQIGMGGRASG